MLNQVPSGQAGTGHQVDDRKTRPERRFEARRVVFIVLPILFILFICSIFFRSCQDPMGGGLAAKGLTATKTATRGVDYVQVGGAFPTVALVTAVPERRVARGLPVFNCWVLSDVERDGMLLPANSQVALTGFTFARGGLVEVSGLGWISQGLVRCDGDVRDLEKPYAIQHTPTPTLSPTIVPTVKSQVVVRVITATPGPVMAVPTASLYYSNGLWMDAAGCLNVQIYGVREIYVNGAAATGGARYCDVRSLEIKW